MSKSRNMISFVEAVRSGYGMQAQYACRYLIETEGYPYFGEDLHFEGTRDDYYDIMIDEDDAVIFIKRLEELKQSQGW